MSKAPSHPCPEYEGPQFSSAWTPERARQITDALCGTYQDQGGISHIDGANMPERVKIIAALEDILELCFPGYTGRRPVSRAGLEFVVGDLVNQVFETLCPQVRRALAYRCKVECCDGCDCTRQAEEAVLGLLDDLPRLRGLLKEDVAAALDGDPAARSNDEIIISYPGLKAIAVNRIAHAFYAAKIPLIPRVMSEYAHTETGIDIHPGATVGRGFFIDHGTGVVVGETATIGNNVKIYQGVTLGALSFPKDACGRLIKGAKRHPNIEDDVTIYAGATILGDITVGKGSVIGGNVWLTESVPPNTKITIAPPSLSIRQRGGREATS